MINVDALALSICCSVVLSVGPVSAHLITHLLLNVSHYRAYSTVFLGTTALIFNLVMTHYHVTDYTLT